MGLYDVLAYLPYSDALGGSLCSELYVAKIFFKDKDGVGANQTNGGIREGA